MIAYLEGIVRSTTDKYIILDVNGVGYRVTVPAKMMSIIPENGQRVKIFTRYLINPREGNVELFGFGKPEELQFFELLTSISGIGPRSAQAILSAVDLETLHMAIMRGDSETLRAAGIGIKTAQRLVLELKSKVESLPLSLAGAAHYESDSQIIEALVGLGYSHFQARDALKNLPDQSTGLEDRISAALKLLGQKK